MATYTVTRPRGITVHGELFPKGATVTSEQIGARGSEFSMANMGWIKEASAKQVPSAVQKPPEAAPRKNRGKRTG